MISTCAVASDAQTVSIFAASSLKTVLDTIIAKKDLDAVAVYGGSATLARQIAQGAGADIVILAHPLWMDWLDDQSALKSDSRCNVIGNRLVLAAQGNVSSLNPTSSEDLIAALNGGRLAVGQLDTVPAGQYAAEYLTQKGWLSAVRPHLAETSNVRLALALVARGEVPLGFVYASDVFAEDRVRTVFQPNPQDYPAIRYPMAITATASDAGTEVAQVIAQSGDIFAATGFSPLSQDEAGRCQ